MSWSCTFRLVSTYSAFLRLRKSLSVTIPWVDLLGLMLENTQATNFKTEFQPFCQLCTPYIKMEHRPQESTNVLLVLPLLCVRHCVNNCSQDLLPLMLMLLLLNIVEPTARHLSASLSPLERGLIYLLTTEFFFHVLWWLCRWTSAQWKLILMLGGFASLLFIAHSFPFGCWSFRIWDEKNAVNM